MANIQSDPKQLKALIKEALAEALAQQESQLDDLEADSPGARARAPIAAETSAEVLVEEIRSLLAACHYPEAQGLAREAALRYPDHPKVAGMNRALNEWAATTHPASGVDRSQETEWMSQDLPDSLRGKIVALVGAEVVAAADTMAELGEKLRSVTLTKRPLVFRAAQ